MAGLTLHRHMTRMRSRSDGASPDTAGSALFAAYCGQIARLRDAQTRLADEGTIIEDGKSNPIPHPALRIEREAQDEIRKFMGRFGENV